MDNYSMWARHEREMEAALASRPVCDYCGEHVQEDHYFAINGEVICPGCLESMRVSLEG